MIVIVRISAVIRSQFTVCVIGRRANSIIISYLGVFKSALVDYGAREIVV